jgi:DNA-binding GntR family transcriptional regulator
MESVRPFPSKSADSEVLSTSVADQLRIAISHCEVAPGAKLRLEELREAFGVSLSPLREALSRLVAEGFVVAESQRGFRAAPVSVENLHEITALRLMLEPKALREAIAHGDEAWEARVAGALYQLKKHSLGSSGEVLTSEALERWEAVHRSFHLTLLSGARMPLLLQFCTNLHDLSDRYRRLFLQSRMPRDRLVPGEHELMAETALARQADRAAELLAGHIERISNQVLKTVSHHNEGLAPPLRSRGDRPVRAKR